MLVRKHTAFLNVIIFGLFVSFVGATEQTASTVSPLSLKSISGNAAECDCGPHEECQTNNDGKKKCVCVDGFELNNGICEKCDCGENGICEFNKGVKTCNCLSDYAEKDGICTKCTCFLPLVDDIKLTLGCTFENGVEKCKCPDGYKNENSKCIDIDECLDPTSCPNDTNCENMPGSYSCFCKAGYTGINNNPKRYGCQDINECEYGACRLNDSLTCVNTEGSFYCECKPGYSSNSRTQAAIQLLGCEKDGLGIGYIILIVGIVVVVVGAVVFVAIKKFKR